MISIGCSKRNRMWFTLSFRHRLVRGWCGFFLGFALPGDRWARLRPRGRSCLPLRLSIIRRVG